MRADERLAHPVSNGFANGTNASTPKKTVNASINGHSPNGSHPPQANGSTKRISPDPNARYQSHNREEVVRIMMQSLNDMGYTEAARSLSEESGYEVESPQIVHFRNAITEGQWTRAEEILFGSYPGDQGEGSDTVQTQNKDGLVLAEGAERAQMLFWIRKQKFVELLFQRNLAQALMVLRQELTPLNHDIQQLHYLSGLLMCPAEELDFQIDCPNTTPEQQRYMLLQNLTSAIAPSVMIRDHRLSELLDQVKKGQINDCLYHNTSASPSLYSDHHCERENFPLRTWMELTEHTGEVWYLQFSHDGTKLATASSDKSVIIYETVEFSVLHRLTRHDKPVTYLAWSPDDTKIISCSMDKQARVWDAVGGFIIMHVDHQTPDDTHLSAAAWHPDSDSFVTSSFDRKTPLCHWNSDPLIDAHLLHKWDEGLRLADCAISRDGKRLVAIDSEQCLYVFDFNTYEEEYRIPFPAKLTSLTISIDSKSMLVNLTSGEVDLVDIATGDIIRQFEGQKQGHFIIRSTFGGAAENFVLSGSEDGKIYVWHKENGRLIETLRGHGQGETNTTCVNAVSWNPTDAGMFASAGDDQKIRIWTSTVSPNEAVPSALDRPSSRQVFGRTSALRSTYRGDSNL